MCICVHVCVQVSVQLCIFHVLKAIRKEILKLIPKDKQQKVYSIIHSLVYTRSNDMFQTHLDKLSRYDVLTHTSGQIGFQYEHSGPC